MRSHAYSLYYKLNLQGLPVLGLRSDVQVSDQTGNRDTMKVLTYHNYLITICISFFFGGGIINA